jgi:hypothetical protein
MEKVVCIGLGRVIKPVAECSYLVVGTNAQVPPKKDLEDLRIMEPKGGRSRWEETFSSNQGWGIER